MLTVQVVIAIIGGILFLLGLIGGGLETRGTKIPELTIGSRMLLIVIGVGFLGIAVCLNTDQNCLGPIADPPPPTDPPPIGENPSNPAIIALTMASSSTKQKWLEQIVANFHDEGKTTNTGAPIQITVEPVLSGGSMNAILAGDLKPVVWSPGAESWVAQFKEKWHQKTHKSLISKPCQPTIYTPLGFAMWRPMAEALGWPEKPIGWQTIVELAADPTGWERYGHPQWGKFHFGHAHPKYSNAGLLTMTSLVYGISKSTTLTPADVYALPIETALQNLAQNTSKYGMITTNLLNLMAKQGPHYLHAVATFESDTIRLNLERADELRFPMIFIFPAEGTFWGNHPYCVLDKADWVTEEQIEAATIFLDYLRAPSQQNLAIDHLLRPLDSQIPLHAPLDLANGTDPQITPKTVPPLVFPNAEISAAIIDLFMITKRKATILIVLDTSGSMTGDKMRTTTHATINFLKRLHPDDIVGVFTFSDTIKTLTKPTRIGDVIEQLSTQISTLVSSGSTALHQAVCQTTALIQELQTTDLANQENRLYGVVLLSDGDDTKGHPTENQMFTTCLPTHAEANGVKIFPIAFGKDANRALLQRIADVTGGHLFTANPKSIDKTYLKISAEQ